MIKEPARKAKAPPTQEEKRAEWRSEYRKNPVKRKAYQKKRYNAKKTQIREENRLRHHALRDKRIGEILCRYKNRCNVCHQRITQPMRAYAAEVRRQRGNRKKILNPKPLPSHVMAAARWNSSTKWRLICVVCMQGGV